MAGTPEDGSNLIVMPTGSICVRCICTLYSCLAVFSTHWPLERSFTLIAGCRPRKLPAAGLRGAPRQRKANRCPGVVADVVDSQGHKLPPNKKESEAACAIIL